ncbi:MAG: efflux transporter outer membrane subunit [Paracoccaceae bacterium]
MIRNALCAAPLLVVASCATVGPDYSPPAISLTSHFFGEASAPLVDAAYEQWWTGFDDPALNELVSRGLAQNLSIRGARERIRQAEAALARAGGAAQASGGISAEALRSRDGSGSIDTHEGLTGNAAFVFDLFGGFRRGREAAQANLEAARQDEGTVRLAYLSDIVDAYVAARYYQNTAWLTRQAIESRRATLAAVNRQLTAGDATRLEVTRAEASLRTAQATLPPAQSGFETNVFRIATLLAEPAGPIFERMKAGARQPLPRRAAGSGTPADLLRNRPDIRAAERDLAAATASIGVAEAALYPSLTLSGVVTDVEEHTWSFGPRLALPVFNRGLLDANRRQAVAVAAEAELAWRATVLNAVEEVQAARAQTIYWRRQVAAQRAAVESTTEVQALTRRSFDSGEILFSDVLDADRVSLESQMSLAAGARDLAISWVRLQVATGRGSQVGLTVAPTGPMPLAAN